MGEAVVSAVVWLVAGVVFVYDVLTLPFYSLVQWPWRQVRRARRTRVSVRPPQPPRQPGGRGVLCRRVRLRQKWCPSERGESYIFT